MNLGERIRELRTFRKMTQESLEGKTGIKRVYISRLENNDHKNPTYFTLLKLAKDLGVSITDLVNVETE